MAKLVAQPDIVEFIDFMLIQGAESVVLEQISCENLSNCFAGKSISALDVANTSGANIIGLKRKDKSYLINPQRDTILTSMDKIFALGNREQIKQLIRTLSMSDS